MGSRPLACFESRLAHNLKVLLLALATICFFVGIFFYYGQCWGLCQLIQTAVAHHGIGRHVLTLTPKQGVTIGKVCS